MLDLLESIFVDLAIPAGRYPPNPTIAANLLDIPNPTLAEMGRELRITIAEFSDPEVGYIESALSVYPLPAKNSLLPGIALIPSLTGAVGETIPLGGNLELLLSGDLSTGMAIEIRPGGATGRTGLLTDATTSLTGELKAAIQTRATPEPTTVFEGPGDSRLTIEQFSTVLGVIVDSRGTADVYWELNLQGAALRIAAGEDDGFLQKILPSEPIESSFDLTAGWSSERQIYFRGSGSLEITIPVHKSLGPIRLETIYIEIAIDGDGAFSLTVAISAGAQLGPVAASVANIGARIPASLPPGGGNAGPFQIESPRFKPPTGVGLAVDASGIAGGGVIEFDEDNKRYAGMLGLNFGEIGLTAIGLITTQMPDGSPGFAMVVIIGVTFSPPIQLVMGFTLSGVGGLLGINRSMDIEFLQGGIRNRTLDPILFPEISTFIQNASTNFSILRGAFPPVDGRYIVGPMVKIGWGSPNVITADIGIFIEFPAPIRIVLMGQVEANFPKPESPVVVIHLDILGVVDIEKQELTFQASLYDSRIMKFALSGDSAFLLGWGQDRRFALSLGGFHPKFTPPPPPIVFANLRRMTLSISSGPDFQLAGTAYQALTPNSLQFGSRVELYAKKGSATVTGHLGFDTLIYFSPFSFEVTIGAGVRIKYKGKSLAEIDLAMVLSGPTPWNARGKAKFKFLGVSAKVGFNVTWGSPVPISLPAVDPWGPLQEALENRDNWGSALSPGQSMVELLRPLDEETTDQIVIHPAGRLEVRQTVVPLDIGLDLFGNAPVTGHDYFDINKITVESSELNLEPVEEFFARGQYEQLSSQQKLSVPSFEKMKGGVTATSRDIRVDGEKVDAPLAYESIIIKPDRTSTEPGAGSIDWEEDAQHITKANDVQRWAQLAGPRKRFSAPRMQSKVDVPREELYCIAKAEDLTRAEDVDEEIGRENRGMTRMAADQSYAKLRPERAVQLIVIPEYEVAAT